MKKEIKMALSNKEYVDAAGRYCPNCESHRVEASDGDMLSDDTMAYQDVTCVDCGATWTDMYTLVGYGKLKIKLSQ